MTGERISIPEATPMSKRQDEAPLNFPVQPVAEFAEFAQFLHHSHLLDGGSPRPLLILHGPSCSLQGHPHPSLSL